MYSQRSEEEHILKACAAIDKGRVLDIGAWDPVTFSNSRALIDRGWGGLLVEFSPASVRNLVKAYGRHVEVEILQAAVIAERCPIKAFEVTDDAVSAEVGSAHTETWKTAGNYIGKMLVPCFTVSDLMDLRGRFDFVNIDTEGSSVDLLKVLVMTEMFPQCICFEHDNRIVEALEAARARGYHPVYESVENIVLSR